MPGVRYYKKKTPRHNGTLSLGCGKIDDSYFPSKLLLCFQIFYMENGCVPLWENINILQKQMSTWASAQKMTTLFEVGKMYNGEFVYGNLPSPTIILLFGPMQISLNPQSTGTLLLMLTAVQGPAPKAKQSLTAVPCLQGQILNLASSGSKQVSFLSRVRHLRCKQ